MDTALIPTLIDALLQDLPYDAPAKRMHGTTFGDELEQAQRVLAQARSNAQAAKRMRAYRARQRAGVPTSEVPVEINEEQTAQAWRVIGPLWPVIQRVSISKRRKAARLGSVLDDVAADTAERLLTQVHGAPFTIEELAEAAYELADSGLPRHQKGKVRKWLMAAINRQMNFTLHDIADEQSKTVSLESLENTHAAIDALDGPDHFYDTFRADRQCGVQGAQFVGPGQFDILPTLLVVSFEIARRGLDPLVEVLLANLRSDGTIAWKQCAESVFRCDPLVENAWDAVRDATTDYADPDARRGLAARVRTRVLFDWLPDAMRDITTITNQYA